MLWSRTNEDFVAMNAWEHLGRRFRVVMASDVIRDGMALEPTDLDGPDHETVLEAFWHDDGSGFAFIAHSQCVLPSPRNAANAVKPAGGATTARSPRPIPRPARHCFHDALGLGTLWTSFVMVPTFWHDHPLVCHLGVTPRGDVTPKGNSRRLPCCSGSKLLSRDGCQRPLPTAGHAGYCARGYRCACGGR